MHPEHYLWLVLAFWEVIGLVCHVIGMTKAETGVSITCWTRLDDQVCVLYGVVLCQKFQENLQKNMQNRRRMRMRLYGVECADEMGGIFQAA